MTRSLYSIRGARALSCRVVVLQLSAALAALASLAGAPEVSAQASLEPPIGFLSSDRFTFDAGAPFELQLGGLAFSAQGEPVVFERSEVRVESASGSRVLAEFRSPLFGAFLELAPDGQHVYFGESSENGIWRISMAADVEPVLVDRIAFNFDLAFAPAAAGKIASIGLVSGFGTTENSSIWLLDEDPDAENDEIVAGVSPFSGPLAFDDLGRLYVVTAGLVQEEDGAAANLVLRYTPERIESAIGEGALTREDGEIVHGPFHGWFDMVWLDGAFYGTNLGFTKSPAAVESLTPDGDFRVFAPATGTSPGYLAGHRGASGFVAGEGRSGGSLLVGHSDFFSAAGVFEIAPEVWFVRGEVNASGSVDLSDAITLLDWLFNAGSEPDPIEAGDVNADDQIDIADPIYLLSFLFHGGNPIPAPFPERGPAPRP